MINEVCRGLCPFPLPGWWQDHDLSLFEGMYHLGLDRTAPGRKMAVLCAMPRDGRELLLQMGVGVKKKRPVGRRSSKGMECCGLEDAEAAVLGGNAGGCKAVG